MYNDPMMAILLYRMDVRRAEENIVHMPEPLDDRRRSTRRVPREAGFRGSRAGVSNRAGLVRSIIRKTNAGRE